jgi:hypothetical protein
MYAELEKIICSGIRRGNNFTYALLDERVKPSKPLEKDEALTRLARRYFKSRAPATAADFSTWSGLTLTDCNRGLESIKNEVRPITMDDIKYYCLKDTALDRKIIPGMYFLPIYDEYIMGYKDRSAILEYTNSLEDKPSFKYDCMIIDNGQIIGTWRRAITTKKIELHYDLFKEPTNAQKKRLDKALGQFSQFYGLPVEI